MARVAGAALLSLGLACWLARDDGRSPAGRGIVAAVLLYNVAVIAVFGYTNLGLGIAGVGLWPAVGVHTVLGVWCVACLRSDNPTRVT